MSPSADAGGMGMTLLLKSFAQGVFGRPALYGIPAAIPWLGLGETRYRKPGPPAPMPRRAAALALGTREASLREAEHRRANASLLSSELREAGLTPDPIQLVSPPPDALAGYLRLPLLLPNGKGGVPSTHQALAHGLSPGYPDTLPELSELRAFHAAPAQPWPGAERLVNTLVTLPVHSLVTGADRRHLITELAKCRG